MLRPNVCPPAPTTLPPARLGALSLVVFALVALFALAACREGAVDRPDAAVPTDGGVERVLSAAPFQRSAVTLVGALGGKPNAWAFERFDAQLRMRDGVPVALEVAIETASLISSDPALRARLRGASLLDPATHARASFRATRLRVLSRAGEATTYAADGTLSLVGKRHEVTLPVVLAPVDGELVARLEVPVGRAAWGAAFAGASADVFEETLTLRGRLVFPGAGGPR